MRAALARPFGIGTWKASVPRQNQMYVLQDAGAGEEVLGDVSSGALIVH